MVAAFGGDRDLSRQENILPEKTIEAIDESNPIGAIPRYRPRLVWGGHGEPLQAQKSCPKNMESRGSRGDSRIAPTEVKERSPIVCPKPSY